MAERALKLWDNDEFAHLILYQEGNRKKSWKVVSSAIEHLKEKTWNVQVRKEAMHVVELYKLQGSDEVF